MVEERSVREGRERKMFFFLSFNEEVSLLVSGVWILF